MLLITRVFSETGFNKSFLRKEKLACFVFLLVGAFTLLCAEELEAGAGNKQLQKTLTSEILSENESSHLVESVSEFDSERDKPSKHKVDGRLTTAAFSLLEPITDPTFLGLKRFEEPFVAAIKRVARKRDFVEPWEGLRAAQKKQLIFAGKGFETQRFEKDSDGKLSVDYFYHIISNLERSLPAQVKDSLDLREDRLRDNRNLIFHLSTTLLNDKELNEVGFLAFEETFTEKIIPMIDAIPQTYLLMDSSPKNMLVLRRDPSVIDLLAEEENLNWKRYNDQ